jgi:CspA family cold shock protein
MGSCWSGWLFFDQGAEPIGLPTVALLRGASTVIGGLRPLPDGPRLGEPTARLLAELYREIGAGRHPAWALRAAQLSLWNDPDSRQWWKWASVGCITAAPNLSRLPVGLAPREAGRDEMISPESLQERRPTKTRGYVKWFNSDNGYGFLVELGTERDVFVHFSEIDRPGFRTLDAGQQVEFEVIESLRGLSAKSVRLV